MSERENSESSFGAFWPDLLLAGWLVLLWH